MKKKSLLNWSEISREFTDGDRTRILEHYTRNVDDALPWIEQIKEKEQEIRAIINDYKLHKKIGNAIKEIEIIENIKKSMK